MKKRIGIIVDDLMSSKQLYDLIKLSLSAKNYEISTIIINNFSKKNKGLILDSLKYINNRGLLKFCSSVVFKIICKIEETLIKQLNGYDNFFKKYDLNEFNLEVINLNPIISKSGIVYRYTNEDLKKIQKKNLNLLIRAGSGILKGEILSICPNGVLSFHHGDNDINRGGPPGFWEVYNNQPRTGFIIQRLTEELDGGDVLYKGFVTTLWMYTLNLVRLYEVSFPFMHLIIENITSPIPNLKIKNKVPYCYPLFTTPKTTQTIIYIFKTIKILIRKIFRKITGRNYRWNIAYQFSENWNNITLRHSKKIRNPRNRFLADPFLIKRNGSYFCFVEDYNYLNKRGCISAYKISKDGYKELGVALAEDFHLSYPYLFEYENELYMCPETKEKGDIRLYKCVEFPLKWKFYKVLIKNIRAVDTNIFYRNNKWWLMCNISNNFFADSNSELHIFHNSNPIESDWQPHKNNPVISDPLRARNGGFLTDQKEIYRVYQKQGFDMYGKSLGISKIFKIDAENYDEESLFEIDAKFFDKARGIHHYSFKEGLVAFDYVEINKF